ncbi:MAG: transcriptional regulator, AraC family [Variovorax sp.]|nr:transcriptional regulator, AraC family [Variovorax sp.]
MNALSSQQLSPLYRHEVFRSRHADETQALVSAELKPHRSHWGRGAVDASFYRAGLGPMSLCILRYGCEVDIEPDSLDDFVLVQMPLRGRAEVRTGSELVQIHAGQGAVISAHRPVKVKWHAGCEQLMLKIERKHLNEVAKQAFATDDGPDHLTGSNIEFETPFRLDDGIGTQWRRLVAGLVGLLPMPGGGTYDPQWLLHYEDNLIRYLLCHHPNSARRQHDGVRRSVERTDLQPLHRAEEFMRSRLAESQSLDDIARAAGVSRRTLSLMFRRHREASPMEALRNLRLDAAHAQLARRCAASVTDVALGCGFSHLSRFSASYRERFGKLPNETWRSARLC